QNQIRTRRLRLRVRKLYASTLFEELIPLLADARKLPVEQITLDKTGLVFRFLHAQPNEMGYLMRLHGRAYLTLEQQEAMRIVLTECLPKLLDEHCYVTKRKRIRLVNGDAEYVDRFIMSIAYKNKLMRAPYYDGTCYEGRVMAING
ncbi:MAG: hypothetical protein RSC91_12155, partial [Clostridia bacterium]